MNKLLALLLLASASALSTASESVYRLLPSHSVQAEASYLGGDEETERIAKKIAQAKERDADWLKSYIATLEPRPGEFLPYHPRLGITKSEYEYFASRANKLNLVSLGKVAVKVEASRGQTKVFISGDRLRLTFLIDPSQNSITTSRGRMTTRTEINADKSTPLGAWKGEQWSRSDERIGFREKIAIGRSADGSVAIIYYDIISPGEGIVSHFIIRYPI